jgi:endonuclease/exonuclease/phosphatase family metal-dependent hydrolase
MCDDDERAVAVRNNRNVLARPFVVVSWNLCGCGVPGTYTRDRKIARGALPGSPASRELDAAATWSKRLPLLVDELAPLDADVIALQENANGDEADSCAAQLGARLGLHVCEDDLEGGLAFLSQWPIRSTRNLELAADTFGYPAPLVVELTVRTERVTCVVVHLPLARCGDRTAFVAELARAMRGVEPPLLVCGDLNAEPDDPLVEMLLASGLVDATAAAGPTMPNPEPQVRLDYVLVRSGRATTSVRPATTHGSRADDLGFLPSDHLGVAVELEL